jgi:putative colanic acid biosynthesis acetyltransferase WcaF
MATSAEYIPDSKKVNLAQFSNPEYSAGAGTLKLILWYFVNVVFFINPLNPISSLKVWLLRWFGAKVGQGVVIKPSVNIKYPWLLTVGNHCWLGERVWIDNLVTVSLHNNVCLSQGAMLLTGNHNYKSTNFSLITGPITLEEGSWVGAKSLVCPGVVVGSHAVLAAGSVATANLEPYTIYQGNPARAVRERKITR